MKILKRIIVILIVILIISSLALLYIYQSDKKNANFTPIDIIAQINTEIVIEPKDCISEKNYDASKLKLDLSNVDTSKEGVYPYSISYGLYKKTANVKIVDAEKKPYKAKYNYTTIYEDFNKDKLVYNCNAENNGCKIELDNNFDKEVFKTPGKYNLTYKIIYNNNSYEEETVIEILNNNEWQDYQNKLKMINQN